MELRDLGSHLRTELRIQVGKRLVEQEDLRVTDDGTAQRNTLSLAAGKRLRLSVEQVGNIENTGSLFNAALDLILRRLSELQAERHVIINGHMRVQSIVLEHHRDISVLRRHIVCELVADIKLALADLFKAGDHSQCRGLTAAGRSDENDKLLVFNVQAEIRDGRNAAGVNLIDIFQCYTCHKFFLLIMVIWSRRLTTSLTTTSRFRCTHYNRILIR